MLLGTHTGTRDPDNPTWTCCPFSLQCSMLKEELRKEDAQKEQKEAQGKELKLCKIVS